MASFRSLFEELKRRKVYQTAAVYVVVVSGVIQVVDVIWGALGLPPGGLRVVVVLAILGLPVVVVLEWAFEISSAGVRRTSPREDRPAGKGLIGRRALVGGVLLLVAGLGAGGLFIRDGLGPGMESVDPAAVAPFPCEVRESEALVDMGEGMVYLLASRLQSGTRSLRPIDPRSVLSYLDREGFDPGDSEAARRMALRLGAGQYILCDIFELFEGQLQVSAALYRTDGEGEPVVDASAEGESAEFASLADDLAAQILIGSGGSASRLAQEAARITEPVPFEVWGPFIEGERAYRAGAFEEAVAAFRDAAEVDPNFVLAHVRMAHSAWWAEEHEVTAEALTAARARADRLSAHDRALLEAFTAYSRGSHMEARELYTAITRAYPDDLQAWYMLGEVLFHYGWLSGEPVSSADSALSRAAGLDPGNSHFDILFHLTHLAGATGDSVRFDSLTSKLEQLSPADPWVNVPRALFRGNLASQDSVMDAITGGDLAQFFFSELAPTLPVGERIATAFTGAGQPEWNQALGHLDLAGIRIATGRWDEAMEAVERAAQLRPALALEIKAYLALAAAPQLVVGELAAVERELEEWPGTATEQPQGRRSHEAPHAGLRPWLRLYLLGLIEARLGDTESALRRADALRDAEPPDGLENWLRDAEMVVRAEAARAEGDPERALELLTEAPLWTVSFDPRFSPILAHFYPVVLRAELLTELGRPGSALRWYRALDLPFFIPTDAIGTRILLGMARAHEALGEQDAARALREEFRERWRGPEINVADASPP